MQHYLETICIYALKTFFLKKKFNIFFFQINFILVFLYRFGILILKINFKK
jgi:hypothetical protein